MNRSISRIAVTVVGHLIGVGVVAALLAVATLGSASGIVLGALVSGDIAGSPAIAVVTHLFLSALVWSAVVVVVRRSFARHDESESPRVIKLERGTALTEFLIILVPFLLLTSGLSQLAIINTAGLLADVAAFNAARAAWVWEAQEDVSDAMVDRKARTAAAIVLAPTAPSDFSTEQAPEVSALVEELGGSGGGGGTSAEHADLYYGTAYDTGTFGERVSKKLYFAFHATTVRHQIVPGEIPGLNEGDPSVILPNDRQAVRIDLQYDMNVVFPWFAYIWGEKKSVAGRSGFYSTIERAHVLPRQQRPIE